MNSIDKIKNIEFLRFLGAISIFFVHFAYITTYVPETENISFFVNMRTNVENAPLWNDFFFVISGFFFFLKTNFDENFMQFFKLKLFRLWPLIIFALTLFMLLALFGFLNHRGYINIFTLFLINNVGFTNETMTGNLHQLWYVSSLFWGMMYYFYLKKLVSDKWFNFITALSIFFCYTFIYNSNTLFSLTTINNFVNIGVLRAIGGLSLGYFVAMLYKTYKQNDNKTLMITKIWITILEFGLLFFIVKNTLFGVFENYLLMVFSFVAILCCFVLKKGYISTILTNNFSVFLGKYSYSIFVMHVLVLYLFRNNLWYKEPMFLALNPEFNVFITLLISLVVGVISYHCIEKPAYLYLKKKWLSE